MVDVAADASSLAEQGNFADAVSLYKIAVGKQPERASLHEQLSQCLLETQQYAEAYAAAVQACSLQPEVSQATCLLLSGWSRAVTDQFVLQWPDAVLTLARCSLSCGLLAQAHVQYVRYLVHHVHLYHSCVCAKFPFATWAMLYPPCIGR